jgi:hypothetical protein
MPQEISRRDLLRLTGATLASLALGLPTLAQAQDQQLWQSWVDKGWQAYDKLKDYRQAEYCFMRAREYGTLRPWEYWALRKSFGYQGRYDRALAAANEAWQTHGDSRSALGLAEARFDLGDAVAARRTLVDMCALPIPAKELKELTDSWEFRRMALFEMDVVVTQDHRAFGYEGRERYGKLGYYECYIPSEMPYQACTASVVACDRSEEVADAAGNRFFRLWPRADEPVQVHMVVTRMPVVYRPGPASFKGYTVPREHEWLLHKAWGIDPTTETVAQIVPKLKTDDVTQTVRNVLAWWKAHVTHYDTLPAVEADKRNKRVNELMKQPGMAQSDFPLIGGCTRCGGITEAMCAVFRGCGIAARWTLGLHHPGNPAGWHTWPDIYLPPHGWVPVDDGLPLGDLHGPIRLCHSMPERSAENANGNIFFTMQPNIITKDVRWYV